MFPAWLGDVASVATLIGLGLTFWQSYRARGAAELSRAEVQSFRADLFLHDLAGECAAATELLDSMLEDHREDKWERLQHRYGVFRRGIASIIESGALATDQDRAFLQEALTQAVRIADRIEDRQHKPISLAEAADLTKQAARQRDKLSVLLGRLRQRIGEGRP